MSNIKWLWLCFRYDISPTKKLYNAKIREFINLSEFAHKEKYETK